MSYDLKKVKLHIFLNIRGHYIYDIMSTKPKYRGLDELSKHVSQEGLIRYLICLSRGVNGDEIASKLNSGANRVNVFRSWLAEGNLILKEGGLTQYGVSELENLKETRESYVVGLLSGMPEELEYFQKLALGQKSLAPLKVPGKGCNNSLAPQEPNEYDKNVLHALKFFIGIEKGLSEDEMARLFNDGEFYHTESGLRKTKTFSKNNGQYIINERGRSKLADLKSRYGGVVSGYLEDIDRLGKKPEDILVKSEPKIKIKKNPVRVVVLAGNDGGGIKPESKKKPAGPKTKITKSEDSLVASSMLEKTTTGAEKEPPLENVAGEHIEGGFKTEAPTYSGIESKEQHPDFKYVIAGGRVNLKHNGTALNVLEIKNMWEPKNQGSKGLKTKISRYVVLLEIVNRTKAKKEDVERFVREQYPQWDYSLEELYRKKCIAEGPGGFLELTELSKELVGSIENKIYGGMIDDFILPHGFDFSLKERRVESNIDGMTVLVPAPYVIGTKIREFNTFREKIPEE